MAFAFFRRHQRVVIIVMAVLMVSFLIGFQGFQAIFSHDPGDEVVGRTEYGEITARDLAAAGSELRMLATVVGLGNPRRMYFNPWPTDAAFLRLMDNEDTAAVAYAVLRRQAERSDVLVTEADVEAFLEGIGLTGAAYEGRMSELRQQREMTEEQFRSVIANWLAVHRIFERSSVAAPPSPQEVRRVFRDLSAEINLRLLTVEAEDFLKFVEDVDPDGEQVRMHFEDHKDELPGEFEGPDSFGFGYRQPDKVELQYLHIRREPIARVARPHEREALRYYLDHKGEFVETVPVDTQPATEPAASDEDVITPRVREMREVQLSFAEARPQIVEKLAAPAVARRMEQLLRDAQQAIQQYDGSEGGDPTAYERARKQMTRPAGAILDEPVSVRIRSLPLADAMRRLSDAAGVEICYPWGEQDDVTIDPGVRVTIEGNEPVPLGEALEQITAQILGPAATRPATDAAGPLIRWRRCEGLPAALFADGGTAGLSSFPLVAGTTEPLTASELSGHPVLGAAATAAQGGRMLGYLAFHAESFVGDTREPALIRVGDDGQAMYVAGGEDGRLLWRLAAATPAHVPEELTGEIRRQVVEDLKLAAAFDLAVARAEQIAADARERGLGPAAEKAAMETTVTEPFARKRLSWGPIAWSVVPTLAMPNAELRGWLIRQVFELAPEDVEPPYPDDPPAVMLLEIPPRRSVAVMQRIGYRPPVQGEFEASTGQRMGRRTVSMYLSQMQQMRALEAYFAFDNVAERVDWKPGEED